MAKLVNATLYNGEGQTLGEEVDNSFRFESGYIHNLVSMNAPLYPNRGRMSGLSEDGKADRVVDKNGMVNPKWVQRVFIEVEVSRNHVKCDGDDMAVHNVGGPERRANAPLAQLVRAQHS